MMALSLILTIKTERPPDIGARKWSDFAKEGMRAAAELWQDKYVGLHFQPFARAKYGYQPRKVETIRRKKGAAAKGKAIKGGVVSLVWTGLLERQMLRRGILRIYPTRFVLRKPAGSYVTNRPRGGRPNLVREITTVIPSEERAMAAAFEERTAQLMNHYRATRRLKV